jgi:hypothetical protein
LRHFEIAFALKQFPIVPPVRGGDRLAGGERAQSSAAALPLLVVCGARKQEVLRARWEHVELGRGAIAMPKAKSGRPRTIPLRPFAAEIVRRQLAAREGDCAWVFPSPTDPGKPVDSVRRAWAAAKRAAGLPGHIVIHSLRHSFASALANSGVALFEIGRVLGHGVRPGSLIGISSLTTITEAKSRRGGTKPALHRAIAVHKPPCATAVGRLTAMLPTPTAPHGAIAER